MANDTRTSLRLPEDLRRRVKRVAEAMTKAGRGLAYSDADIIRTALVRGLDDLEAELKRARH